MIHVQESFYFLLMYKTVKVRKIFNILKKLLRLVSWQSEQLFLRIYFQYSHKFPGSPAIRIDQVPLCFDLSRLFKPCIALVNKRSRMPINIFPFLAVYANVEKLTALSSWFNYLNYQYVHEACGIIYIHIHTFV